MSELNDLNELKEKMEHAGGAHHTQHPFGMNVGVTIAMLGVLLAFCSALGGTQRTELIATMVQQTNAGTKYQALSTKHRILVAQLEQLHSLAPDPNKFKKWDDEANKTINQMSSPDIVKLAHVIRLENAKNLNAEIPSEADLRHFSSVIKELIKETDAAKNWTDSYETAVAAHSEAMEHYESAQLAAEIGIVLASIALLFMNRLAWICSLGLGVTSIVIAAATYIELSNRLAGAETKIEHTREIYESYKSDERSKTAEEVLLKDIDSNNKPDIEP